MPRIPLKRQQTTYCLHSSIFYLYIQYKLTSFGSDRTGMRQLLTVSSIHITDRAWHPSKPTAAFHSDCFCPLRVIFSIVHTFHHALDSMIQQHERLRTFKPSLPSTTYDTRFKQFGQRQLNDLYKFKVYSVCLYKQDILILFKFSCNCNLQFM